MLPKRRSSDRRGKKTTTKQTSKRGRVDRTMAPKAQSRHARQRSDVGPIRQKDEANRPLPRNEVRGEAGTVGDDKSAHVVSVDTARWGVITEGPDGI